MFPRRDMYSKNLINTTLLAGFRNKSGEARRRRPRDMEVEEKENSRQKILISTVMGIWNIWTTTSSSDECVTIY